MILTSIKTSSHIQNHSDKHSTEHLQKDQEIDEEIDEVFSPDGHFCDPEIAELIHRYLFEKHGVLDS